MKNVLIVLSFFILSIQSYGQYTLCDCCTYETLHWTEDFEKWFPPAEIVSDKISQVTVYTTSRQAESINDSTLKMVDPEYKEMILKFNEKGFVIERIYFNRLGKFHSINEFERDSNNRIVTKTFFYLDDSTGVKDETFLPEKWIYSYNKGKLVKEKQLDRKFIELPDNKSEYVSYDYDKAGRIRITLNYTFYDKGSSSIIKSQTKYYDATNSAVTKHKSSGKIFSIQKTIYSTNGYPLEIIGFDGKGKKIESRLYEYSNNGSLIRLQTTNTGMYTECNDGGNLIELYSYSESNLLNRIEHQYKNTVCSLRFEFQ